MFIFILLILIVIYLLVSAPNGVANVKRPEGGWTVYGTMGCGWTRKQLEYMKRNGKPHTFVDCDKGGCDGMDAFPTLVSPEGEKIVGYSEM